MKKRADWEMLPINITEEPVVAKKQRREQRSRQRKSYPWRMNFKLKDKVYGCISLRQWAILSSILIFLTVALVTSCLVLGVLHMKQLLELLDNDIQEERDKHRFDFEGPPGISSNEDKLQRSRQNVSAISKIVSMCMWMGWLNLVVAVILIYGIIAKTPVYIIPWLMLGGATYLLALTAVIMDCFFLFEDFGIFSNPLLLSAFVLVYMLYSHMYFAIILYYWSLRMAPRTSMLVSQAYGNYIHTIPLHVKSQKPSLL